MIQRTVSKRIKNKRVRRACEKKIKLNGTRNCLLVLRTFRGNTFISGAGLANAIAVRKQILIGSVIERQNTNTIEKTLEKKNRYDAE